MWPFERTFDYYLYDDSVKSNDEQEEVVKSKEKQQYDKVNG